MCSECLHTPCDSRCPNAPEPTLYEYCHNCGCEIYLGDDAYVIDDCLYCEDCVNKTKTVAGEDIWSPCYNCTDAVTNITIDGSNIQRQDRR